MLKNLLFQGLQDPSPECRNHFLQSDRGLTSATLVAAMALTPVIVLFDFLYFGAGAGFFRSLVFGLIFIAISLPLTISINRADSAQKYELLVFAWAMLTSAGFSAFGFLQTSRLAEIVAINMFLLLAYHMLIVNRLVYRLVPALVISLAGLITPIFYFTTDIFEDQVPVIMATLAINGIGLVIAARNNLLRSEGFDISQREKSTRDQFETLAGIDYLTGIFNRRHFTENFDLELSRFKRYNSKFSFAFIAIDHFKEINETHGISGGEEALKAFSKIIKDSKRKTDIFGRLDDEEFGLIMMETSGDDTLKTVQRYLAMINEQDIRSANSTFKITFSAGITEIRSNDRNADDLVRRADKALITARELGSNCCILN